MNHRRANRIKRAPAKRLDAPVAMFSYIQNSVEWMNWRFRKVTLRSAMRMVSAGEASATTRKYKGEIVTIYRESQPSRRSHPTPCALSMSVMVALGSSVTPVAPAERPDLALTRGELANIEKFLAWPLVGDERNAATVRAKCSDAHRRQAETMFRRAAGIRPKAREFKPKTQAVHYPAVAAA